MKRQFRGLIAILLAVTLLAGIPLPAIAAEENSKTITLYTLPSVSNMALVGTNRGNYHDKQQLGIYMPAGSSFTICQSNTSYGYDLTLVTYSNATGDDQSYAIPKDGTAVTVTANVDCVPFIETQYHAEDTEQVPVVLISDQSGILDLLYFTYGSDEEAFFTKWREREDAYAVIESNRMTMLVPYGDIDRIVPETQTSYTFSSITELLEYYDEFLEQYDRYIGLSYDAVDPIDRNVATKFFIRADITNANYAAAYYGGAYTAQCGGTIEGYLSKQWLNLHECGHGYEGSLDNLELPLIEVMNNILAYYYEQTYLAEGDGGWLGYIANVEGNFQAQRKSADSFQSYSASAALYFFVNLLNRQDISSEGAMAWAHSTYRRYISQGIQYSATDLFTEAFSNYSGYNLVPYMNSWNLTPSDAVQAEIYEQENPMLYYLRDLVGSDEKAAAIREDLGLEGIYSLVSTDELASYGMTGDLHLTLDIDDLSQIEGKTIYVKDGQETVAAIPVTSASLSANDLPVGIYWLQLPNTKNEAYDYDYEYVVISENSTAEKTVSYKKLIYSALAFDTEIRFLGLGDWQFATADFVLNGSDISLHFQKSGGEPHVYYQDAQYAKIEVLDTAGNLVYSYTMTGVDSSSIDLEIPVEIGYTIHLTHDESSGRLQFISTLLNTKESYSQSGNAMAAYTVTEYGLQPSANTTETALANFLTKLTAYAQKTESEIPEAYRNNKYRYFAYKNNLLSAIQTLPEADADEYLAAYFRTDGTDSLLNGSAPEILETGEIHINVNSCTNTLAPTGFCASDPEDGVICSSGSNTSFDLSNVAFGTAGTYTAAVTVKDLDGNPATESVTVIISDAVTDLVSYDYTDFYTIKSGEALTLDASAAGLLADGSEISGSITWEAVPEDMRKTVGIYTLLGTLSFAGYEDITVAAQLQVVENVIALRNISTTTASGIVPALPETVSGVLTDGTLFGTFAVTWETMSPEQFIAGDIAVINGMADVAGETLPVTASVRVIEKPETTTNVAPGAALREDCTYTADNLNSLNNGVLQSTSSNERWTNFNNRWTSEYAALTFILDDTYLIESLNLYYYVDYYCSTSAESIEILVSEDGITYTGVTGNYTENSDYDYYYGSGYVFTLDTPTAAKYVRLLLQQQGGTSGAYCVGLTEVEIMASMALDRSGSGDLGGITVDGVPVDGFRADTLDYTASGSDVAATTDVNAGITILPVFDNVIRILTISEDGSAAKTYTVTLDSTPVCNHEHTEIRNAKDPTCTVEGYTGDTYCTDCGALVSGGEAIPALGHDYVGVVTAPTCTEQGYTTYTCSHDAGHTYVGDYTAALGHSWDSGVVTKEATEEEEGIMTYTCTVCGETKTEAIPKVVPVKVAPKVTVSAARAASGTKITLTGTFVDYENANKYYNVTAHGLVYLSTSALGTRTLTVNSPGRTKVSFTGYKVDGSFCYTMTPAFASTKYTVRAFLAYTDAAGRTVYVYSNPIIVSYNTLPAATAVCLE